MTPKTFRCPHCGRDSVRIGRTHTVWEMFTVCNVRPNGDYDEADAGAFGDTIEQGDWEEATCTQCEASLDITTLFPAQTPAVPPVSLPAPATLYVAIRRETSDGHAWMDTGTLSLCQETTQAKVSEIDRMIPSWAKANPVVRIVRATLTIDPQ